MVDYVGTEENDRYDNIFNQTEGFGAGVENFKFVTGYTPSVNDLIQLLGDDDYVSADDGRDTLDGGEGYDELDLSDNPGNSGGVIDEGYYVLGKMKGEYACFVDLAEGVATSDGDTQTWKIYEDFPAENLRFSAKRSGIGDYAHEISNFEAVRGTEGSDTLLGDDADNTLDAAGGGADLIDGRDGFDIASFARFVLSSSLRVDLSKGRATTELITFSDGSTTDGETVTLRNVEGAFGSIFADTLIGNADSNLFVGINGADVIDGAGGADTVSYGRKPLGGVLPFVGVTVDLSAGTAVDNFGATDSLTSIENAIGSDFDDRIVGDDGANALQGGAGLDTLSGGEGDDRLFGGGGDDTMDGGAGRDVLSYFEEGGDLGVSIDLAEGKVTDTFGSTDTVTGIEVFELGLGEDTVRGDGGRNDVRGQDGKDAISGEGGDDRLLGEAGDDTLRGGAGRDRIIGGADGDSLLGGDDDDVLYGDEESGSGAGNDRLFGEAGDDTLFGAGGGDVVDGGAGDDRIEGGNANDTLAGGDDGDLIKGDGGDDKIDGGDGDDSLEGGAGKDAFVGGDGKDAVSFVGSKAAIEVSLADGVATGADGKETLSGVEIVIGTALGDRLTGFDEADDTLRGEAGDDTLSGGGGRSRLDGGKGVDQVDYDGLAPKGAKVGVVVDLAAGTAKLGDIRDQLLGIENVGGTKLADSLTGDGEDNELTAGDGDDTLAGGAGDDRLDGGKGRDLASFAGAAKGVNASLETGRATGEGADRLIAVEDLTGSAFDDTLAGSDEANEIKGGDGGDRIGGGGGGDLVLGQDGKDTLDGGAGNDTLEGGEGDDKISDGAGANEIEGDAGDDTLTGGAASDTLSGGDDDDRLEDLKGDNDLDGGAGDDEIVAGGGGDEISGGDGSDTIEGGAGADELAGGEGNDEISDEAGVNEIDGEEGDDTLTGGRNEDSIDGGDGDDEIDAGGGKTNGLLGGTGNDTMSGGSGSDLFEAFGLTDPDTGETTGSVTGDVSGNDVIDGGGGDDAVGYLGAKSGVKVDLATGRASGGSGADRLTSIEGVGGSNFDDTLTGSGNSETFVGYKGDDLIEAGGGADTIIGTAGKDTIDGGAGVDTIVFDSALRARIEAGDEDDAYTLIDTASGAQADVLISIEKFEGSADDDRVTGDEKSKDGIAVSGGDGDDTIAGSGGDDTLGGGGGDDVLSGLAGDDRLIGGLDADTLDGGAGDDRLAGGAGKDRLIGGDGGDVFVFDSPSGADVVVGFGRGDGLEIDAKAYGLDLPKGALDDGAFVATNDPKPSGSDPQVLYDRNDGAMFLDLDGKGGDGPILIATLTGRPDLAADDFRIV